MKKESKVIAKVQKWFQRLLEEHVIAPKLRLGFGKGMSLFLQTVL